jgi:hypothetical protein
VPVQPRRQRRLRSTKLRFLTKAKICSVKRCGVKRATYS